MSNNKNYMTGNLLDFAYYKENYKLIAIDLGKIFSFSFSLTFVITNYYYDYYDYYYQ